MQRSGLFRLNKPEGVPDHFHLVLAVAEKGGVDAACQLILSKDGTSGLWELMQHKLPKLTVEYIALTGPWHEIMPPDVLEVARTRLRDLAVFEL